MSPGFSFLAAVPYQWTLFAEHIASSWWRGFFTGFPLQHRLHPAPRETVRPEVHVSRCRVSLDEAQRLQRPEFLCRQISHLNLANLLR